MSNDKTARVWQTNAEPENVAVLRHDDLVTHAATGPGSEWLITATIRQLNLWHLRSSHPEGSTLALADHSAPIRTLAIPSRSWSSQ